MYIYLTLLKYIPQAPQAPAPQAIASAPSAPAPTAPTPSPSPSPPPASASAPSSNGASGGGGVEVISPLSILPGYSSHSQTAPFCTALCTWATHQARIRMQSLQRHLVQQECPLFLRPHTPYTAQVVWKVSAKVTSRDAGLTSPPRWRIL